MFAASAVIAIPIAALMAGVTEFLILDCVDQFPPGNWHGAKRSRRRIAVHTPQRQNLLHWLPYARLFPSVTLAGESTRLQSRDLSVSQLPNDYGDHPCAVISPISEI
jgi:hypothetical protein